MRNLQNSVETVNAAATAIVTAETRVQPSMVVQKRRWGNCWSIYSCFGSIKQRKQICHSVFVPPRNPDIPPPTVNNSIIFPFIAPPSSPTAFLQSDPSSCPQSPPPALKSLSVRAQSLDGTTIFTVGPYAHETQLVSPPVFSAFTTEPSTACFTPVERTGPSSPEVPFAELCGVDIKCSLSQYELKPYQYPGSPGSGHVQWPNPGAGTSSPFPDKPPTPNMVFHIGDLKGPRPGSGSSGLGSSNARITRLTPSSGTLTHNGGELVSANSNQIHEDGVVDHRVSFELFGEDIPICIMRELVPSDKYAREVQPKQISDGTSNAGVVVVHPEEERDDSNEKHRTISFGSSKEFHFDNSEEDEGEKSGVECEWWTKDNKGVEKEWRFFSMLQSSAR